MLASMVPKALRRALRDTFAHRVFVALSGALGFAIAFGLYWLWLGQEVALAELQIWAIGAVGAFGAVLILFLFNLTATPYRLQRERANGLENTAKALAGRVAELEPKGTPPALRFEFEAGKGKYLESTTEIAGRRRKAIRIGRVGVRNISQTTTAKDVEVTVINYRQAGVEKPVTIDKKIFSNSLNQPIVDIHPWRFESFNLFKARDDGQPANVVRLGPYPDGTYTVLEPGKYRIKVCVSGDSIPRATAMFRLIFNGRETNIEFIAEGTDDTIT